MVFPNWNHRRIEIKVDMGGLFLFSGKIKSWISSFKFQTIKVWKGFLLIFKLKKNIRLKHLSYFKEWRFEKSYLIIHFDFKNAVWYELKTIRRSNCKRPIILNLENLKEDKVEFIVHGLFRRKTYLIDTTKSETLLTEDFKTRLKNINVIGEISTAFSLTKQEPSIVSHDINFELDEIDLNTKPININLNIYNQAEFI